jgi:homoserine dehydrogenase
MPAVIEAARPLSSAPTKRSPRVRTARICMLGCGVIGREVARVLIESRQRIAQNTGIDLALERILVHDPFKRRDVDSSLLTCNFDDLLKMEPDVVIEVMGGVQPAGGYVAATLERGIPVVTANKTLIAREGSRLRALASRHSAAIACEASVGAAVPVLAALRQLAGDEIRSIRGIINGSCNYILTRMSQAKLTLHDAVSEAIELGFAEPDPAADISGIDSAEKLCVLAAAIGWPGIGPGDLRVDGIETITAGDIGAARAHGYVIKLLAQLENLNGELALSVGPALVRRDHALARTQGADNAVAIHSAGGGPLWIQGRGAGPRPTASAVIGDVLRVLEGDRCAFAAHLAPKLAPETRSHRFFVRLTGAIGQLKPDHVLNALRIHDLDVNHIEFRNDSVVILTDETNRKRIAGAVESLTKQERSTQYFMAEILDEL